MSPFQIQGREAKSGEVRQMYKDLNSREKSVKVIQKRPSTKHRRRDQSKKESVKDERRRASYLLFLHQG